MGKSTWEVPDLFGASAEATSTDTNKYLYDIRSGVENLRRTVVGVGTVIIVILTAQTWFS